jgi:glutamine amidotransferase
MIAVVDYDMGNLRSVQKAITRLGFKCIITRDTEELNKADKLIIPGVGNFKNGIKNLEEFNLIGVLNKLVLDLGKPVLGICLGMQLMTDMSEEGNCEGLGWISGKTVRFKSERLKVPHIGWNTVEMKDKLDLFNELNSDDEFYFVHSYYVKCKNENEVVFKTNYGISFDSGFKKKNILGVQFHPEKSHLSGLKILKGFLNQ